MTLAGTLALTDRAAPSRPVVLFSYVNPDAPLRPRRFLREADALGPAGLLLTDLPVGRRSAVRIGGPGESLDLIRLVAPTTRPDRRPEAAAAGGGLPLLRLAPGVTGATGAVVGAGGARSRGPLRGAGTRRRGIRNLHPPLTAFRGAGRRGRGGGARWWMRSGANEICARRFLEALRAGLDAHAGVA